MKEYRLIERDGKKLVETTVVTAGKTVWKTPGGSGTLTLPDNTTIRIVGDVATHTSDLRELMDPKSWQNVSAKASVAVTSSDRVDTRYLHPDMQAGIRKQGYHIVTKETGKVPVEEGNDQEIELSVKDKTRTVTVVNDKGRGYRITGDTVIQAADIFLRKFEVKAGKLEILGDQAGTTYQSNKGKGTVTVVEQEVRTYAAGTKWDKEPTSIKHAVYDIQGDARSRVEVGEPGMPEFILDFKDQAAGQLTKNGKNEDVMKFTPETAQGARVEIWRTQAQDVNPLGIKDMRNKMESITTLTNDHGEAKRSQSLLYTGDFGQRLLVEQKDGKTVVTDLDGQFLGPNSRGLRFFFAGLPFQVKSNGFELDAGMMMRDAKDKARVTVLTRAGNPANATINIVNSGGKSLIYIRYDNDSLQPIDYNGSLKDDPDPKANAHVLQAGSVIEVGQGINIVPILHELLRVKGTDKRNGSEMTQEFILGGQMNRFVNVNFDMKIDGNTIHVDKEGKITTDWDPRYMPKQDGTQERTCWFSREMGFQQGKLVSLEGSYELQGYYGAGRVSFSFGQDAGGKPQLLGFAPDLPDDYQPGPNEPDLRGRAYTVADTEISGEGFRFVLCAGARVFKDETKPGAMIIEEGVLSLRGGRDQVVLGRDGRFALATGGKPGGPDLPPGTLEGRTDQVTGIFTATKGTVLIQKKELVRTPGIKIIESMLVLTPGIKIIDSGFKKDNEAHIQVLVPDNEKGETGHTQFAIELDIEPTRDAHGDIAEAQCEQIAKAVQEKTKALFAQKKQMHIRGKDEIDGNKAQFAVLDRSNRHLGTFIAGTQDKGGKAQLRSETNWTGIIKTDRYLVAMERGYGALYLNEHQFTEREWTEDEIKKSPELHREWLAKLGSTPEERAGKGLLIDEHGRLDDAPYLKKQRLVDPVTGKETEFTVKKEKTTADVFSVGQAGLMERSPEVREIYKGVQGYVIQKWDSKGIPIACDYVQGDLVIVTRDHIWDTENKTFRKVNQVSFMRDMVDAKGKPIKVEYKLSDVWSKAQENGSKSAKLRKQAKENEEGYVKEWRTFLQTGKVAAADPDRAFGWLFQGWRQSAYYAYNQRESWRMGATEFYFGFLFNPAMYVRGWSDGLFGTNYVEDAIKDMSFMKELGEVNQEIDDIRAGKRLSPKLWKPGRKEKKPGAGEISTCS